MKKLAVPLAAILLSFTSIAFAGYQFQFGSPVILVSSGNSQNPGTGSEPDSGGEGGGGETNPGIPSDYNEKNFQCQGKVGPSSISFNCENGTFSAKVGPSTITGVCVSNTYTVLTPTERATATCL